MGLLARLHPELAPVLPKHEPAPLAARLVVQERPDRRPDWVKRMDQGGLPAKVLVR